MRNCLGMAPARNFRWRGGARSMGRTRLRGRERARPTDWDADRQERRDRVARNSQYPSACASPCKLAGTGLALPAISRDDRDRTAQNHQYPGPQRRTPWRCPHTVNACGHAANIFGRTAGRGSEGAGRRDGHRQRHAAPAASPRPAAQGAGLHRPRAETAGDKQFGRAWA